MGVGTAGSRGAGWTGSPREPESNFSQGVSGTRREVTAPVVGWVPSPHSSLISSPQACHGARTLLYYKGSETWSLSQQDESEDKNTAVGTVQPGPTGLPLVGWGEFSHGLPEGAVDSPPLLPLSVTLKGGQRRRTRGTRIPGGPRRSFQAAGRWRDGVDAPFSACPGLRGGKAERPEIQRCHPTTIGRQPIGRAGEKGSRSGSGGSSWAALHVECRASLRVPSCRGTMMTMRRVIPTLELWCR